MQSDHQTGLMSILFFATQRIRLGIHRSTKTVVYRVALITDLTSRPRLTFNPYTSPLSEQDMSLIMTSLHACQKLCKFNSAYKVGLHANM